MLTRSGCVSGGSLLGGVFNITGIVFGASHKTIYNLH